MIRLFRKQGVVYDFEVRWWTKSGTIREVLLSVERIELDGVPCALSIAHDVTERRELERELIEISERERQRIGYDLHDTLGQHLAGIAFLSKVLEQRLTARHAAKPPRRHRLSPLSTRPSSRLVRWQEAWRQSPWRPMVWSSPCRN